jgi:predicted Zn-dependent protease
MTTKLDGGRRRFQLRRARRLCAYVLVWGVSFAFAPGPADAQIFMSKAQEKEIGQQEHPKILKSYGVYPDSALSGYIAQIGGSIAANSNDPNVGYTMTLLNSPIVNAFALPGGYVYITRGILALANSEAEVAGVLGHEIGHVTARHTAKRYDRAIGTGILGAIVGAVTGNQIASELFNLGGQLYLAGFSRQQEYEADLLGVRSLARTGYDPYAEADFLATLDAETNLEAKLAGTEPQRMQFFATHPNTPDRVKSAIEEAKKQGVAMNGKPRNRDIYLTKIEGMIYGDSPSDGFVRGQTFMHPELKLSFKVPDGFSLQNSPEAVVATAKDGSGIQFDGGKAPAGRDPKTYLTNDFANEIKVRPRNIETFDVNGMRAATGTARAQTSDGSTVDVRMTAIEYESGTMYRFLMITPTNLTKSRDSALRATIMSFRKLSDSEAAALKPLRIHVVTAGAGDSVASLSSRMSFNDYREERFRVLNGLGTSGQVVAGERYKIITE